MGVTEEQSHDKCALVHKFQIKSAGKKIQTVLGGLKVKDDVVHTDSNTVSYKCFFIDNFLIVPCDDTVMWPLQVYQVSCEIRPIQTYFPICQQAQQANLSECPPWKLGGETTQTGQVGQKVSSLNGAKEVSLP